MDRRFRITVTGIVQGVGYRPHVYGLAVARGLKGYVLNSSRGVTVEVEGPGAEGFSELLRESRPPLAVVESVISEELPPAAYDRFEVRLSEPIPGEFALISPDIAVCLDCLREMSDPADRRYRYPFINCTNCGPRYSIVKGVPYDRPLTTMRPFKMCPDCESEYNDPTDRRFHAQPTACAKCGPSLRFRPSLPPCSTPDLEPGSKGLESDERHSREGGNPALIEAISLMSSGKILALKGLGGFQLACDATDDAAVDLLRDRKRKSRKPFALMARDMDVIRRYCEISDVEEALLASRTAPIVLLRKHDDAAPLPDAVSPGNRFIGFMLPYTPLHHLLFIGGLEVLVMTSGNLSEEPIVIDNDEAVEKLSGLADGFLTHDRDIYMRVDDSVARVLSGVPRLIRRARGYVPEPLDLGREVPEILACVGELKNTLCITKNNYAIISQHIGDLTNVEAMGFFEETLRNLKRTFNAHPCAVAHDLHPDYLSTRFAVGYETECGDGTVRRVGVQHHHAHIASCMAENGYSDRVIGVAFDGTGYGTDGNSWGSEFIVADFSGFDRRAHLAYMPLPGGDKAVKEPWRMAYSLLHAAYGYDSAKVFMEVNRHLPDPAVFRLLPKMLERRINSPLSSGMGRLFDGISSLVGLCDVITFEGEAAIALETAAGPADGSYPVEIGDGVIDTAPLVRAVVEDIRLGAPVPVIAGRFHNTVADMTVSVCNYISADTGIGTVALSGGVFQNALLFGLVTKGLEASGLRVLTHSRVPSNDACISLGQAAVAAHVTGV